MTISQTTINGQHVPSAHDDGRGESVEQLRAQLQRRVGVLVELAVLEALTPHQVDGRHVLRQHCADLQDQLLYPLQHLAMRMQASMQASSSASLKISNHRALQLKSVNTHAHTRTHTLTTHEVTVHTHIHTQVRSTHTHTHTHTNTRG